MNNLQQRKLNKYQSELAFMGDSAADFPKDSVGEKTADNLSIKVASILALAGEQVSNVARQNISIKGDKLQELIDLLQKMNRAANAMADEIDGIEDRFRMPRRRAEEVWLATARTFHTDSAGLESNFEEYSLPNTFRADILALVNAVETASTAADVAENQRAGATGGLADLFRDCGKLSRKLNAIVLNKYSGNAQKLAAWAVASHLESAPKKKEEPKPPTP
ncbi:MAG: hypothetical protein MUC29_01080 [Pyrinomonadaceae bacterium]|nr:hypothetical protein [Pyrinomonadaceae bacterium]